MGCTTFTKNRDRLLDGDIAQQFFLGIKDQARAQGLLSDEHFTVDGTLLEASASQKSFQRKGDPTPPRDDDPGNPTVDFHGERRSNATHESSTDPEARLCRKGKGREAKLAYLGNLLMDNREGLAAAAQVSIATGDAETLAALELVEELERRAARITVGADKLFDNEAFVAGMRFMEATPHVAQNTKGRRSRAPLRRARDHDAKRLITMPKRAITMAETRNAPTPLRPGADGAAPSRAGASRGR